MRTGSALLLSTFLLFGCAADAADASDVADTTDALTASATKARTTFLGDVSPGDPDDVAIAPSAAKPYAAACFVADATSYSFGVDADDAVAPAAHVKLRLVEEASFREVAHATGSVDGAAKNVFGTSKPLAKGKRYCVVVVTTQSLALTLNVDAADE